MAMPQKHTLEQAVASTIARHRLVAPGEHLYIALSGGTDSVALLRAMLALDYSVSALHCNFHLRDVESDSDECFVRQLCQSLGVPLEVKHFDTLAYSQDRGISIEMAARELRYTWFREMMQQQNVHRLAVGHNADDQIETLLLNLSMGTGIRGLSGMPYLRSDGIIRPLMDCSRLDIESYLNDIGQSYCTDRTNADTLYKRNYIRHTLLPAFESLNPSFRRNAAQTIEHLRAVERLYMQAIEQHTKTIFTEKGIHIAQLLETPYAEAILYEILHPIGFSSAQVHGIYAELETLSSGAKFFSPTHVAIRGGEYLEILTKDTLETSNRLLSIDITTNGSLSLPHGALHWQIIPRNAIESLRLPKDEAVFDYDALIRVSTTLTLRKRWEGDKLYPFGMRGGKLLRRIFIDQGFSHAARHSALLLCLDDQILWLVGNLADRRYAVNNETQMCLHLSFKTN